jgi:GAF domain-containing protein
VSANGDPLAQLERVRLESDTLYRVIGVVASSPDLGRVLEGLVELLTEATQCHACFIYLREGPRLHLRAASRGYARLVGRIEMGLDEGLAGWVARHKTPAYIRENALADPRMKVVPEIDEERFQSLVAVPIPARSGESIGVVVLHTQAPREFGPEVLNFLAHTASLMAGAIENAQLYEDARRRVQELTLLSRLAQEIASATGREELYRVVTSGVRALLRCDVCQLYLLDPDAGRLELAAAEPSGRASALPGEEGTFVLLDVLRRRGRLATERVLAAPMAAGEEHLGVLTAIREQAFGDDEDELLRTAANQVAVALKRLELIEHLTETNLVRDAFEALAAGAEEVAAARARALGYELQRSHVVVHVEPAAREPHRPWPALAERTEARLRRLAPGVICDPGRDQLRALLPLRTGDAGELAELEGALDELARAERVAVGVSEPRRGAADGRRSLREAADAATAVHALRPGGGALGYERLGAYKYLVRLPADAALDDRHAQAIRRVVDYDQRRRAQLTDTLEQFLRDRRSIAATARALYIHPNTLRQRLRRIEQLSGLVLADEDLLSLELAIKVARLRPAAEGR